MALATYSIIVTADFDDEGDEESFRGICKEKAQELVAMGVLLSGKRRPQVRFKEEHTWNGVSEHEIGE
jgi:hypothetical protein